MGRIGRKYANITIAMTDLLLTIKEVYDITETMNKRMLVYIVNPIVTIKYMYKFI
jgi:hypothetical protein